MANTADLELSIRSSVDTNFLVDLRFSPANSDADERVSTSIQMDVSALNTITSPEEYGKDLGKAILSNPGVGKMMAAARAAAKATNATLRMRLLVADERDRQLHGVRWETMRDTDGTELFNGNEIWFSRYLSSSNWKPVASRPERGLKALVMIASPSELPPGMSALPVEKEKAWAEKSLAGIAVSQLISGSEKAEDRPTVSNLLSRLRDGFDILFVICHGQMKEEGPRLWLENGEGKADVVRAAALVEAMKTLPKLPRLVVLASCQSAGTGASDDALAAFGPSLAEAGVPAVVAMQGKVAMETVDEFMPTFFTELRRDGQIDRAMAVARADAILKKRKDYWMPVLFMRLRSGCLWYKPGFGLNPDSERDAVRWRSIKGAVEDGQCTPILGPGMMEGFAGSTRDIARDLAGTRFPMSAAAMEELPTVAQFLAVEEESTNFPRRQLRELLMNKLFERFGDRLKAFDPDEVRSEPDVLGRFVSEAGKLHLADTPIDPHHALARRPFKIYITVNADNLMEDALIAAGRNPRSDFARWNATVADIAHFPGIRDREPDYVPSAKNPLVYHLYGQLSLPPSMVITEDDYFDYLLSINNKAEGKNLTPTWLGRALTANALLFIGFRLEDWGFRVLLRSIYSKEGSSARLVGNQSLPCVGAQITPDEDRILKPDGAKAYFQKYLKSSNIDIFWGGVEEFVSELETVMGAAK